MLPNKTSPHASLPGASLPRASFPRASLPRASLPGASLPGASLSIASLSGTSLPGQRCQLLPSLLHGSWKLWGELFGTGAHDPDALDVLIEGYEIIGLPISKHFQTRKSVESLIQVSQYFVFFFVSLKEKNAEYVFNGGFKTGFLKWWCSFVAKDIITKSIFGRNIIARTEMPDPALLTPWIMKAISWAFWHRSLWPRCSRCSNCRLWNYWTSNIKALSTRKSVESLIPVNQYFLFFFCIFKGKKMLSMCWIGF